ncbi:uncharacterized protein V6R79_005911 [Siganus canaliculatus]
MSEHARTLEDARTQDDGRTLEDLRTLEDARTLEDLRTLEDARTLEDVRTLEDLRTLEDARTLEDVRTLEDARTLEDVRTLLQSSDTLHPQSTVRFYDRWAQTYEQDLKLLDYRASHLGANYLIENFCGNREEALVLDVACGSGRVARLLAEDGFRRFVGVDGSRAMLDLAAKTGLYQNLQLALLGPEPLPVETGVFDVVIIVGALDAGFIPVSVVRELCHASKPGGLVCMARGDHVGEAARKYQEDLERELQLMEEEGLWSLVSTREEPRYMENPQGNPEEQPEQCFISGKGPNRAHGPPGTQQGSWTTWDPTGLMDYLGPNSSSMKTHGATVGSKLELRILSRELEQDQEPRTENKTIQQRFELKNIWSSGEQLMVYGPLNAALVQIQVQSQIQVSAVPPSECS